MTKHLICLLLALCSEFRSQALWHVREDTAIKYYYQGGDEFEGKRVDTDLWKFSGWTRTIYTNNEQQYYTDGHNHSIDNGLLQLIAHRDTLTKRTIDALPDDDSLFAGGKFYSLNKRTFEFTSGQLISVGDFSAGYYECRFRFVGGRGYWPAFWLYSGNPTEEIDILEAKTERPSAIHIDTHCENRCDDVQRLLKDRSFGGWVKTKIDFQEGFNVVSCLWGKDEIRFYINGQCIGISKVTFTRPKKLIVNLAVPSDNGPFKPGPKRNDTLGAVFEVDYIRFFNRDVGKRKIAELAAPVGDSERRPTSLLKNRPKYIYGKKDEHLDDGFFIFVSRSNGSVQIKLLGIPKQEAFTYSVSVQDGSAVLQGVMEGNVQSIDTKNLKRGNYELLIEADGKQLVYPFDVR